MISHINHDNSWPILPMISHINHDIPYINGTNGTILSSIHCDFCPRNIMVNWWVNPWLNSPAKNKRGSLENTRNKSRFAGEIIYKYQGPSSAKVRMVRWYTRGYHEIFIQQSSFCRLNMVNPHVSSFSQIFSIIMVGSSRSSQPRLRGSTSPLACRVPAQTSWMGTSLF
jgi:hypothetical protein